MDSGLAAPLPAYQLIDAGDGRRLERFGPHVLDRTHPAATWRRRDPGAWAAADLRFDRERGWSGRADPAEPWAIELASGTATPADGITLELRATESGGLGLFPEQLENLAWLVAAIEQRRGAAGDGTERPGILNLFAHTGLLTLAAARASAAVTHVDGAKSAVAWARRNAELSGLADAPIRWIVDDALAFVAREARRGREYRGVVLDPPAYGHARGQVWQLEEHLDPLLAACAAVAAPGAFVLLTIHSEGVALDAVVDTVARAFDRRPRELEIVPLEIEAATGIGLPLGNAIRTRR